jgi:hypothetical protein
MKTILLKKGTPSVGELLAVARDESVLPVAEDGPRSVLEEADDFDRDATKLGNSKRFMSFLDERWGEWSVTSIDTLPGDLGREDRRPFRRI